MRSFALSVFVLAVACQALGSAAEPPAVEAYLHSGDLMKGQKDLESALANSPGDDERRFGLGVLKFVRGVEKLAQSFHKYGLKSEHQNAPFLRLPVPINPEPATIDYTIFRGILDDFRKDLMASEATLAMVKDDNVALPLRLADVRLDLDGDGKPTERFVDVLKKIMRQDFEFLKDNPEFLVRFDRGDVAWMRAYCHLLSGMLDFYLAFDSQKDFDLWGDTAFAKVKTPFAGTNFERRQKSGEAHRVVRIVEPARLEQFRQHFIKVAELNRETWKSIRAETDNDHEWLPSPKQESVLRMPVRDEMIDAWLAAVTEIEALLEGKKLMFYIGKENKEDMGKGINMKRLCQDPPAELEWEKIFENGPDKKYLEKGEFISFDTLFRVGRVFDNPTMVAYVAWFN
jgi:hypothetical protein